MVKPIVRKFNKSFLQNGKRIVQKEGILYEFKKLELDGDTEAYYSMQSIEDEVNKINDKLIKAKKFKATIQIGINTKYGYFPSPNIQVNKKGINLDREIFEYMEDLTEQGRDDVNPWNKQSKDSILNFTLRIVNPPSAKGGADNENNCLWIALMKCGITRWPQPSLLRVFLGIPKGEMIPASCIRRIEKECNVPIQIVGDVERTPEIPINGRVVTIQLKNNHYTAYIPKERRSELKTILYDEERPICVWQTIDGKVKYCTKNGLCDEVPKKIFKVKLENLNSILPKSERTNDLETGYDILKSQFDKLKEYSKGKINPYRIGFVNQLIGYHLLKSIVLCGVTFEDIEPYEILFLEGATRGAYVFCKKGEYKKVFDYDVKSAFPFCLITRDKRLMIPVKAGTLKNANTKYFMESYTKGKLSYGIYHCKVGYDEKYQYKFRYNNKDYYTNYDLAIAAKCGITDIELIGENNFLQYNINDCAAIGSHILFDEYIKYIYDFKKEHSDCYLFKAMISRCWGFLTQGNTRYINADVTDDSITYEGEEDDVVLDAEVGNNECKLKVKSSLHPYKYNIGRLKPFLLSFQRLDMWERVISKYSDNIVRFQTDGFLTDIKIDEFSKDTKEMGAIICKQEKKNVTLKHVNSII